MPENNSDTAPEAADLPVEIPQSFSEVLESINELLTDVPEDVKACTQFFSGFNWEVSEEVQTVYLPILKELLPVLQKEIPQYQTLAAEIEKGKKSDTRISALRLKLKAAYEHLVGLERKDQNSRVIQDRATTKEKYASMTDELVKHVGILATYEEGSHAKDYAESVERIANILKDAERKILIAIREKLAEISTSLQPEARTIKNTADSTATGTTQSGGSYTLTPLTPHTPPLVPMQANPQFIMAPAEGLQKREKAINPDLLSEKPTSPYGKELIRRFNKGPTTEQNRMGHIKFLFKVLTMPDKPNVPVFPDEATGGLSVPGDLLVKLPQYMNHAVSHVGPFTRAADAMEIILGKGLPANCQREPGSPDNFGLFLLQELQAGQYTDAIIQQAEDEKKGVLRVALLYRSIQSSQIALAEIDINRAVEKAIHAFSIIKLCTTIEKIMDIGDGTGLLKIISGDFARTTNTINTPPPSPLQNLFRPIDTSWGEQ